MQTGRQSECVCMCVCVCVMQYLTVVGAVGLTAAAAGLFFVVGIGTRMPF